MGGLFQELSITATYGESADMDDVLDQLRLDPGSRTIGQLLQERSWAAHEISRLRAELLRVRSAQARGGSLGRSPDGTPTNSAMPENAKVRLIRLRELKQIVSLSTSTIYAMMKQGRFPRSVHLGERTTAWRLADVIAWQEALPE